MIDTKNKDAHRRQDSLGQLVQKHPQRRPAAVSHKTDYRSPSQVYSHVTAF